MAGAAGFGTRKSPVITERRKARRDRVGIAVSLLSLSQSRVVVMLDVAPDGARTGGSDLPGLGKDILLRIADVELFGRVIRHGNGEAAVKFDHAISAPELEALRGVVAEQTQVTMLHAR